jgi:hypothetical protein
LLGISFFRTNPDVKWTGIRVPRSRKNRPRNKRSSVTTGFGKVVLEDARLKAMAHVSIIGRRGEFTADYIPGIAAAGTILSYRGQRFLIERVLVLGRQEKMKIIGMLVPDVQA